MFQELTKKSIKKVLPAVLVLCIIGGVLMGLFAREFVCALGKDKVFEELLPEEIKPGLIVEAHIKENFGICMEEYESSNSSRGVHTKSYHVIWTGDDDAEDYRFMVIELAAKYDSEMENMAEAFYYGESVEPITFRGRIEKMTKEELKYFYEYFEEAEYTAEEIEEATLPYKIVAGNVAGMKAGSYVLFGLGAVIFFIGVIMLVSALRGGKLKKLKKEIEASGYSVDRVESDYARRQKVCEAPEIFMGDAFVYFSQGAVPHVVLKKEIVWIYYSATAHRVNGIKVANTYGLNIVTKDKKTFALDVATKNKVIASVESLSAKLPWAVAGYSEELAAMFRNNYSQFLEIAYHKAEDEFFDRAAASFETSDTYGGTAE